MSDEAFDRQEWPDADRLPRHVAVIMDGNGRWAESRNLPKIAGHRAGTDAARTTIECCGRLGIEALTLYSFSTENWNRPPEEVEALMGLILEMLPGEQDELMRRGVRFRMIGDREGMPGRVMKAIEAAEARTAGNTRLTLNIALNYGGRQELVHAMHTLGERIASGEIRPDQIDEAMVSSTLWTAGLPDPDLLIRTAGEMRISNFLLWQISYAEIVVDERRWPDFDEAAMAEALRAYARRDRRFGARPDESTAG